MRARALPRSARRMRAHYRRARARLDKLARDRRNTSPLRPQYVAATIDEVADRPSALVSTVGTTPRFAALAGA